MNALKSLLKKNSKMKRYLILDDNVHEPTLLADEDDIIHDVADLSLAIQIAEEAESPLILDLLNYKIYSLEDARRILAAEQQDSNPS